MRHTINKKKNTLVFVLVFATAIVACFAIYDMLLHGNRILAVSLATLGIRCIRWVIQDYKVWISFTDEGLSMYRRGKTYEYKWTDIKRIRYRGAWVVPWFDVLEIRTNDKVKLGVEWSFNNYKEVWREIKGYLEKYSPQTIIDDNIPFYEDGTLPF